MEKERLSSLVTSAQQGDDHALNELFNAYYNDVYYFALKTLKDANLACDITQEAFVEIIDTIGNLKEPAAFVTWMKQITYHQCTRYFKKKKEVLADEDEDGHSVFDTIAEDRSEFIPDKALDQEDFRKTILAMIDTLSEEQRATILLYYYDELTTKSIAEIMGISESTVKSRLIYARRAIKRSVEEYEKKTGIRLHSVAMFPLIAWLFAGAQESLPATALPVVVGGITTATGAAIAVSSTSAAAAAAAATATATATATAAATGTGLLAKLAGIPIAVKIIAGVTAASLVVGSVTTALLPDNTPTEPTVALQTTIATEPPLTEPPITEPAVTEPPATQPPVTEPPVTEPPATEPSVTVFYVPEGCTYVCSNGTSLRPGEAMPATISDGDEFITQDYTYKYGYTLEPVPMGDFVGIGWADTELDGWSVDTNNKRQETYAELYETINGAPLLSMRRTFYECFDMKQSPSIPDTVQDLLGTYVYCGKMTESPKIPSGVTNMSETFSHSGLEKAPTIPEGVKTLDCAFMSTMIETAPVIPQSVTDLGSTFLHCIRLTEGPMIMGHIENMNWAFYECANMVVPPVIKGSVKYMYAAFSYCTSLTDAPVLPDGVTDISAAFSECTSLTQVPVIPDSVTNMQSAFSGCTSLTQAPVIPASVTDMSYAFWKCTSLTGSVVVHANPSNYDACFDRTEQAIALIGKSSLLNEIAAVSGNSNVTVAPTNGIWNDAVEWSYSWDTATLTLNGYGDADVMEFEETYAPYIESIRVGAEIQSVGVLDGIYYNLTHFIVDTNNPYLASEDQGGLYNKDMTKLYRIPTGFQGDYIIPEGVVSIQEHSFPDCNKLISVTLPSTLTEYLTDYHGNWAHNLKRYIVHKDNPQFASDDQGVLYNKDMSYVLIVPCGFDGEFIVPETVTHLQPAYAISRCDKLTAIHAGPAVTDLDGTGDWAYFVCESLQHIWVDKDNPDFCSDEYGVLYTKDMTKLLCIPRAYQGRYAVLEGVTTIGLCAVESCNGLTDLQLPEGLASIYELGIASCKGLTSLTLPSSLTFLGPRSFQNCANLAELRFLGGGEWFTHHVGDYHLDSCIKTVYYPAGDETWTEDIFNTYPDITWISYS